MKSVLRNLLETPSIRRAGSYLIPKNVRYNIERAVLRKDRNIVLKAALSGKTANLDDVLLQQSNKNICSAPLILISQVQRSGGTLLSQLLDGHPQLLAHPQELKIGWPDKADWPPVNTRMNAQDAFHMLFETVSIELMKNRYKKSKNSDITKDFFFFPSLQKSLFLKLWDRNPPSTQREIIDIYFSSYFRSWLNFRGNVDEAKYISAFVPRLSYSPESVGGFFNAYPDGWLVNIIRNPFNWYPSAARHSKQDQFGTLTGAVGYWRKSADSIIMHKERYGNRVIVIDFDELVRNTEEQMKRLAHIVGIDFHPSLAIPSYNGEAIAPNSSFETKTTGTIVQDVTERKSVLSQEEREYIGSECEHVYRSIVENYAT